MRRDAEALGLDATPLGDLKLPRFQVRTVAQPLAGEAFEVHSAALLFGVSAAPGAAADAGQEEMELE